MSDDLITINPDDALTVFTTAGGIDKYIDIIRDKVKDFSGDASTATGREEIASIAYKISRSKTAMEKIGKQLCDDERSKISETVDAIMISRKKIDAELSALKDQVRKPLTDFESADKEILDRIERMATIPDFYSGIEKHLVRLKATDIADGSFKEHSAIAASTRKTAIYECEERLERLAIMEAEAVEDAIICLEKVGNLTPTRIVEAIKSGKIKNLYFEVKNEK